MCKKDRGIRHLQMAHFRAIACKKGRGRENYCQVRARVRGPRWISGQLKVLAHALAGASTCEVQSAAVGVERACVRNPSHDCSSPSTASVIARDCVPGGVMVLAC